MIHHGDCLDVMATLDPESIDAIVTDPPYGLGFMGKHWDHGMPGPDFFREMLRVAKPGAHLLAFGGTRTYHRLAVAIEDAGWEIRDCLVWAYATGFPKSHNLDGDWQGWGTALKPAWEPIVMARKPLRGTVAGNVTAYGTGALNIDGTRIGTAPESRPNTPMTFRRSDTGTDGRTNDGRDAATWDRYSSDWVPRPADMTLGRWPANVILTDPIFDGGVDGVVGGGEAGGGFGVRGKGEQRQDRRNKHDDWGMVNDRFEVGQIVGYGDTGTYSRFFLIPKADRAEREPAVGRTDERANLHPTVKPLDLMRHLVRLVTPPGGTVLDPFLGSGTTGIAAEMEGFDWVGVEREAEYVAISRARLEGTQRGLAL